MTTRRQLLAYGCASVAAGTWSTAFSQSGSVWPTQTVRLIVPLVAGGGADVVGRALADWLSKRWKQPVVIENRPGADGVIGVRAMLASRDGHTLLFSPSFTVAGIEILRKNLPYDPARDIQPIASVTEDYIGVLVPPSFSVKSIDEMIDRARAAPNSINFITPPGVTLMLWQAFQKRTGATMTYVPYRSIFAGIPDLMEGRVQLGLVPMSTILSQVRGGKLRVLAVASDTRCPFAPDAPTLIELGHENLFHRGLLGFYGPKTLSTALRDRIASDLHTALADPAIKKTLEQTGFVNAPTTPAELSDLLAKQRARWTTIALKYDLKAQ